MAWKGGEIVMPQLGFKRFLGPKIKDGSKPHTIRAKRKHPFKVGARLYMYHDLRQKSCEKIGEADVSKVEEIHVLCGEIGANVFIDGRELGWDEVISLAIKDGFDDVSGLLDFIFENHGADFTGDLIHWTNFQPAKP
jgi:hypothetical protein